MGLKTHGQQIQQHSPTAMNGPSTAQAALAIIVMASLPGSIRQAYPVSTTPLCPTWK
jgi:hypothetical protein